MYSPSDSRTDPRVYSLRLLFRHLQQFRSLAESDGIHEITAPNGAVLALSDIEYLYRRAMQRPIKVVPRRVSSDEIPIGYYLYHSGGWRAVTGVEQDNKGRTCYLLEDDRRKKFAEVESVFVLSPQQKRARDYNRANPTLPLRQQQAIELFLVWNMPENDAARALGVSLTNPIGMYATSGLTKLLKLIDQGLLDRFIDDDNKMLSVA